jgi:2',3'-cyclic-nucleotide 2'-phosphodiesterase (5'-nucleotidase family)
MKHFFALLALLYFVTMGCDRAFTAKETATLTIFHTNDMMGYLTPCG